MRLLLVIIGALWAQSPAARVIPVEVGRIVHPVAAEVVASSPSARQRILLAIADPNIAFLLLFLGTLGIYAEFSAPGLVAPGAVGAVLVLLGVTGLSMFPIDWRGAALMIVALCCFGLEAKFATRGVLTAGGALAMVPGATMLIDTSAPELRIHLGTALGITIPFALLTSFLLSIAVRARRNKVIAQRLDS